MLDQFLRTGRGIAFNQMFAMTEYPQDIMPLYAQGYSLAEYLIQIGGRRKYVEFLADGLQGRRLGRRRPSPLRVHGPRHVARHLAGLGEAGRTVDDAVAHQTGGTGIASAAAAGSTA